MKDKNIIVVAVGLVMIIAIAVWVIHADNESAAQSIKGINTTNSFLLQQKDLQIEKLVKQLDAKQKELDGMKAALEGVKEKVSSAKADLSSITEKPAAR